MVKAVIFGVGGQDGQYLSRLCEQAGYQVIGSSRQKGSQPGDVGDRQFVDALLAEHRPELIFHLAARSSTRQDAIFENHRTISGGTWNVLQSAWDHCRNSRVFITGSGLQFRNQGAPIHEGDPFDAGSAYAVERIHSVHAARYFRDRGLSTYVGYLFHHESPLRGPEHVSMKILEGARRVADGELDCLDLGDLSVSKEWTFAGDVASGILTLIEQDEVFEAVIGSGQAHSIRDWARLCFAEQGLSWQDHVQEIEGYRAEYPILVSNPSTMHDLGWEASMGIEDLCRMMSAAARPLQVAGDRI
ncbi:MAG: GDP-mannose 4,6-dehydratase [Planctomycetota bacterium]